MKFHWNFYCKLNTKSWEMRIRNLNLPCTKYLLIGLVKNHFNPLQIWRQCLSIFLSNFNFSNKLYELSLTPIIFFGKILANSCTHFVENLYYGDGILWCTSKLHIKCKLCKHIIDNAGLYRHPFKFDTNIGLLVGGFKSTTFYLLNIFCISSILFPFVSGTKKNVNSPPARQIAPYSQKVPLPPEHI